ncbi:MULTISPECIES: hypothetical protein [unclassified Pseudomonas]|uniref:hypothetical protein n=1 Tax=unclassified Pseudomonas TaxID=196821 RepID=UPI00111373C2|nr:MULTISPECIES: hypothetical protein [unclassified Pseudomonas]
MIKEMMAIFVALSFQLAKAENLNYSSVSEANSGRIGETLIRYIKRFGDECLHIEIISTDRKWTVLSSLHLCSFEGKPFSTGFAYVGFEDFTFKKDGISFKLSTTPLEPVGEQIRECLISVSNNQLGKLQCSDVRNPE